jgi:tRNA A-37 threonylcarbamoyl transferase component Bud32
VDEISSKTCLWGDLARELDGFRISASPLNPGLQPKKILSKVKECRVVKATKRRQVYYLQTPDGGYFLKRSSLVRPKDRWRHILLPRRRWAEWRNLHRLSQARVPAAKPLLKGQSLIDNPKSFFILTAQVPGNHVSNNSYANARSLGQYAAFLHQRRIYHADLNRKNFILDPQGEHCLLDAQEVYFLPWMPNWIRIHNLGLITFNLCSQEDPQPWVTEFLAGYNQGFSLVVNPSDVINAARRHRHRHDRSRSKRCCKNSTQFEIVKERQLRGYKRRGFAWGARELQQAEENGNPLKEAHVIGYRGVCIKKQPRKLLHQNRCLASWKMSRALEVRGISVPRSLGYLVLDGCNFFLSELLDDSQHLNDYLSAVTDQRTKRQELNKLALWVRNIHDARIWQRDFKSNNILCRQGQFFMIDLEGVRIRRLTDRDRITNLAQLNASLSNAVSIKDRLRFFDYYFAGDRLTRLQRRRVYRKIWDITRTKGTAHYNLDLEEFTICR